MNWKDWFSFGYGLEEWKRDRHAFFVVMIGFAVVDLPMVAQGKLDWPTFLLHAKVAAILGVVSVLKNLSLNNDPPK